MSDDERAIRQLVDTWHAASKAGDTAKVLSLMADDVLFLVAGRQFGKAEFAAQSQKMTDIESRGELVARLFADHLYDTYHQAVSHLPRA